MKHLLLTCVAMLFATTLFAQLEKGKTYRIVPLSATGKSLFIKDAAPSSNADIVLWTETNVPAQQWVVNVASSYFTMRNANSQQYLSPKTTGRGGTLVTSTALANSRWRLEPVDEEKLIYKIRPTTGSYYLTANETEDGTLPALATLSDDNMGQQWQFIEVTDPQSGFTTTVRDEMIDKYIARFAQSKGTGFRTFNNGGWGESEQLEVILDAYETTGNQEYLQLATEMFDWFYDRVGATWNGGSKGNYGWYGYDFNDDVMWQIIAVARMAWLTGDTKYRTLSKNNLDIIYNRAYMPEYGLLRWAESSGDRTSANSCINGPTEVAACYLAMAGAGEKYYEMARDLYAKQRQYLFNPSNGQVYDNYVFATGNRNTWASTYNQGTMLGAAVMLYNHYGDQQYKTDAEAIARYSSNNMCNSDGIISVCQVNNGDLCGFKGILMRYIRRYITDLNKPELLDWHKKNALRAYNNRASNGVTTSAWLTKSSTDVATNAFSCSTAASAAANVIMHDVSRDAYQTIQAEEFDYLQGIYVTNGGETNGKIVSNIKDGLWTAYANIDFGSTPAQSVLLQLIFTLSGTGTIEIYLDSMDGDPIGEVTLLKESGWRTVIAPITPTTGRHTVYLKYRYSTRTRVNPYRIDSFYFSTQTADELLVGIKDVKSAESAQSTEIYDLSGRRLPEVPTNMPYIQNGRVHVVR